MQLFWVARYVEAPKSLEGHKAPFWPARAPGSQPHWRCPDLKKSPKAVFSRQICGRLHGRAFLDLPRKTARHRPAHNSDQQKQA